MECDFFTDFVIHKQLNARNFLSIGMQKDKVKAERGYDQKSTIPIKSITIQVSIG